MTSDSHADANKREEKDDEKASADAERSVLRGTTLRVYQFIFRQGRPVRPYEVQRSLKLSSSSVAQYHIAKLLDAHLIHEVENGFMADRLIFGSLVRVRRMVLPFQISFSILFVASLIVLLTVLRPAELTADDVFALVVIRIALGGSLYECLRVLKGF